MSEIQHVKVCEAESLCACSVQWKNTNVQGGKELKETPQYRFREKSLPEFMRVCVCVCAQVLYKCERTCGIA